MPAALYRMTRLQGGTAGNPVMITRATAVPTSRQLWAHLLCSGCERRLHEGGEDYVMRQVHNGERFPLLERLNVAMSLQSMPGLATYSGRAAGIDTYRLGYFAMSIFWRASIRRWPGPHGGEIWQSLGADRRRFGVIS
jgi:hypothetical protein